MTRASFVGPALVLTVAGLVAMVTLDEAVGAVGAVDPPVATEAQMAPATLAAAGNTVSTMHGWTEQVAGVRTGLVGGVAAGHDARGDRGGDGSLAGAALADVVGQTAVGSGDGGSEAGLLQAIGSALVARAAWATTYRAGRHVSSGDGRCGEGEGSEGEDGEDEELHDYWWIGRKVVRRLDTSTRRV
jgi:hypothetical protein